MNILVAVAWPYVNGDLHLGHLAGYLLPADVVARYFRLRGGDVLMVSGSDCHGTPITVQADKEQTTPDTIVNKYHRKDLELFDFYGLTYNLYTKTTTENHREVTQQLFLDLLRNGYIDRGVMKQYYSSEDDEFLPDRYVEGTCPHCSAKEQRSDQCENCGRWLKDGELINPVSKKTGKPVALKDTEHYFLDFPKLADKLKQYVNGKIDGKEKGKTWRPWVFKETTGWLSEGLEKRAITRDLDWGVALPVAQIPAEMRIKDIERKRIYVWFEAVIGYLSASVEWADLVRNTNKSVEKKNSDYILRYYNGQSRDWKRWWFNKDSLHYYFMGQDNLVFHTLMWPGQLIGSGKGYTLPYNVSVNKFMNFNSAKFSKSRGNIIDSKEVGELFGTDTVRFYVLSNLPENKESNFTWQRFLDEVNNDLVANLGNFIHRTLTFIDSKFEGIIPRGTLQNEVRYEIREAFFDTGKLIEKVKLSEALGEIMKLSDFGNKYFNAQEVWSVIKTDQKKAGDILFNCVHIISALGTLLEPFLPLAAQKIHKMLSQTGAIPEVAKNNWRFRKLAPGVKLKNVEPLFKKLEPAAIEQYQAGPKTHNDDKEK